MPGPGALGLARGAPGDFYAETFIRVVFLSTYLNRIRPYL